MLQRLRGQIEDVYAVTRSFFSVIQNLRTRVEIMELKKLIMATTISIPIADN